MAPLGEMEPKIVERQSFKVMGVLTRGTPESADFEGIWLNQFLARRDEVKPHTTDGVYYGVCFCEGKETIGYIASMAVREVITVPEGLVMRRVPARPPMRSSSVLWRPSGRPTVPCTGSRFRRVCTSTTAPPPTSSTTRPTR